MPGAAMGQLRLLDEKHVLRTVAGEMIGKRGADGAAADDQDVDVPVGPKAHAFTFSFLGS